MPDKKLLRLIFSALVTLATWQLYLKAKEQNREISLGLVDVLCAARDIPSQKVLNMGDFRVRQVPALYVQPGSLREKIPGLNAKKVTGKVSLVAIPEGAQITQPMMRAPRAESAGIAPKLAAGQRGYILRLGNLEIAKLILPGDRIDVLATFTVRVVNQEEPTKATYTILQNVAVISVGVNIVDTSRDEKQETKEERILTLALTPQQAQQLTHAQAESQGEISIVVRAYGDDREYRLPPVQTGHLSTGPAPTSATAPPKKR